MIQFIKDWGGLITGFLGIVGSIFVYFRTDRKIKNQEVQINDLHLAGLKEERDAKKKAQINVRCQNHGSGAYRLTVANRGPATANNVVIKILTDLSCLQAGATQEYKSIPPEDVRKDVRLHKCTHDPDEIDVEVSWEDDFSMVNKELRTIGFC